MLRYVHSFIIKVKLSSTFNHDFAMQPRVSPYYLQCFNFANRSLCSTSGDMIPDAKRGCRNFFKGSNTRERPLR